MFVRTKNKFLSFVYVASLIVLIYLIIATGSRFPFYCLILICVGIYSSCFLKFERKIKLKFVSIATIILVFSILFTSLNSHFVARLTDFDQSEQKIVLIKGEVVKITKQDDSSLNLGGRIGAWQFATKTFLKNWIFGVGALEFQKARVENKIHFRNKQDWQRKS